MAFKNYIYVAQKTHCASLKIGWLALVKEIVDVILRLIGILCKQPVERMLNILKLNQPLQTGLVIAVVQRFKYFVIILKGNV
jgi:hypothetical protein